jgi:hypothetical protein
MIENINRALHHSSEGLLNTAKIRDENFNPDIGTTPFQGYGTGSEMTRSLIPQIVPGNTGDHNVVQTQFQRRICKSLGLRNVRRLGHGIPLRNGTKRTAPSAGIAKDHKGRRMVAPTITDVRTPGFLANGDKLFLF